MKRSFSKGRRSVFLQIGGLFAAVAAAPAAQESSENAARKEKNVAAGEKEAKKLLLLMDRDKNGMVSKEEFMSFMEAEFERLDKDKNGQLDVKELTQSQVRSSGAIHR